MASRIRNLAGWSLLAVYGALALLGHAGMHALEGSHVHAHAAETGHGHSHSHADGCCHHHPHATASSDDSKCPDGQDEHHHHHNGHDHDNCLICHHFAAKAALVTHAAPLQLAAGLGQVNCVGHERPTSGSRYVLPIRGPPADIC